MRATIGRRQDLTGEPVIQRGASDRNERIVSWDGSTVPPASDLSECRAASGRCDQTTLIGLDS